MVATPVYHQTLNRLDREYASLTREKIMPWLMQFRSGFTIEDCRGSQISYSGLEFEGSPKLVFWSFMTPCLQDVIHDVLRELAAEIKDSGPEEKKQALEEVAGLLKRFVTNIFDRMVDVDRRLRGKGDPRTVGPYDPSHLIGELHAEIDGQIVGMAGQISVPTKVRKIVEAVEAHPVIAGMVVGIVSIVAATVVGVMSFS